MYKIEWGDDSDVEFYTHAEFLINNIDGLNNVHRLEHDYEESSCAADTGEGETNVDTSVLYTVTLKVYNKFKKLIIAPCNLFEQNGAGASLYPNVGKKPEAISLLTIFIAH